MNYYFTGILIILLTLLAFFVEPAYPANSQTNVSGSNTSIEGGYTGGSTTYESGSSSSTTTNSTSNSNIRSAPPTASAPSYNSMTQDVCAVGVSAGIQTFGIGVSGGKHIIQAGTPCPIDGKIGKEAQALWSKYDHERPDYDVYIKRMKKREKKEKDLERQRLKEQAKMTKEFEKVDKEIEKKIIIPKKKPVNWESPK